MKLVDANGDALTVTAYIGVKGDTNLDHKVTPVDASALLKYYATVQTSTDPDAKAKTQLCSSTKYTGEVYENLAAFLDDVSENEFSEDNFKIAKTERKLQPSDASSILKFYSIMQTTIDPVAYDVWNEVLPGRMLTRV